MGSSFLPVRQRRIDPYPPEAYPHHASGLKSQRLPQADRGEFPHLRPSDLPQEAHGAVRRGQRRVVPGNLDGVQGVALDQLGQELRKGVGAEEDLQTDDPTAEGEDRAEMDAGRRAEDGGDFRPPSLLDTGDPDHDLLVQFIRDYAGWVSFGFLYWSSRLW